MNESCTLAARQPNIFLATAPATTTEHLGSVAVAADGGHEQQATQGTVSPTESADTSESSDIPDSTTEMTAEDGSGQPPTVGPAAMRYYEGKHGGRWEYRGDWCNFLRRRQAHEAQSLANAVLMYWDSGRKKVITDVCPEPDNPVTDLRHKFWTTIKDLEGNPVGQSVALILSELFDNYDQNVDDNGDRPFVVLFDPETGNIRIDYYSFKPVKQKTFDHFASWLNVERPDLEENKGTAGNIKKDVGKGESGRGFPIIVRHTIARGIEWILPESPGARNGVHLMFIINPRPPETKAEEAAPYDPKAVDELLAKEWADKKKPDAKPKDAAEEEAELLDNLGIKLDGVDFDTL